MKKGLGVFALAALLLIAGVTEAPAIAFNTVGGFGTCLVNACGGGPVEVTPHPAWTPNIGPGTPGAGPVWVSYAQTGFGGPVVAPNAAGLTVADATETFQMDIPAGLASLSLLIWGDDSVGVRLDGTTSLLPPSAAGGMFTGPGTPLFIPLDGAAHTIQFDTYQLGGVTFGLMVQGEGLAAVPEPATLLLLGSTLAGMGVLSKRRLRKKQQLS